jgi:hypothetical protein
MAIGWTVLLLDPYASMTLATTVTTPVAGSIEAAENFVDIWGTFVRIVSGVSEQVPYWHSRIRSW